jgi:hypothetical protein
MKWNEYWKGKQRPPISDEHRKRLSDSHKGQKAWNKGVKMDEEFREKCSIRQLGKKRNWSEQGKKSFSEKMTGRKRTKESIEKMSGENHPRWIKDRSLIKIGDRSMNDPLQKQWSLSVKKRDGWKCQIADSNCKGRMESHHILSWKDFPELRYEVNNGITLCHAHHPRVKSEEKRLSPYFMELVSVSKTVK